jgi:hypothetical protein
MDTDELTWLTGRLTALEGFVLMFAGIVVAQAPNDPSHQKAIAILDEVRKSLRSRGDETGSGPEFAGAADELLSKLSESLGLLRRGLSQGEQDCQ